jgi:hypothetical protein
MIDGKTKQKLLDEIQKFGNVYLSCLKTGIGKATYYRWKEKDKKFREQAEKAERMGRENISDVAEHALLQNIKKGDQRAIEYALNHNSERYKQKQTSTVVLLHKKDVPIPNSPIKTLEDLFDEYTDKQINGSIFPQGNQKSSDGPNLNSSNPNKKPDDGAEDLIKS